MLKILLFTVLALPCLAFAGLALPGTQWEDVKNGVSDPSLPAERLFWALSDVVIPSDVKNPVIENLAVQQLAKKLPPHQPMGVVFFQSPKDPNQAEPGIVYSGSEGPRIFRINSLEALTMMHESKPVADALVAMSGLSENDLRNILLKKATKHFGRPMDMGVFADVTKPSEVKGMRDLGHALHEKFSEGLKAPDEKAPAQSGNPSAGAKAQATTHAGAGAAGRPQKGPGEDPHQAFQKMNDLLLKMGLEKKVAVLEKEGKEFDLVAKEDIGDTQKGRTLFSINKGRPSEQMIEELVLSSLNPPHKLVKGPQALDLISQVPRFQAMNQLLKRVVGENYQLGPSIEQARGGADNFGIYRDGKFVDIPFQATGESLRLEGKDLMEKLAHLWSETQK